MIRSLHADVIAYQSRPWAMMRPALSAVVMMARQAPNSVIDAEGHTPRRSVAVGEGRDRSRPAGPRVEVLGIRGVITPQPSFLSMLFGGGGGLSDFARDFQSAVQDEDVSAIVLDIDSPGGLVDLVPETAKLIRDARGAKPIVAVADTRAASAAYWLGAQAEEFVVSPSGDVGSIGVYMTHEDWSVFNEKTGVDVNYISAGKYKTEGNPDEPLSDEAEKHLQAMVDDTYALFVGDVAAGRGVSEADVRKGYGEGRVLTATHALEAGMVDGIETLDSVVSRLATGGATVEREEPDVPDDDDLLDDEAATTRVPAPVAVAQPPASREHTDAEQAERLLRLQLTPRHY